jgi:hypothetical protein
MTTRNNPASPTRRWSPNPDAVFDLAANVQNKKWAVDEANAALGQVKRNLEQADKELQDARMQLRRAKGLTQGEVGALLASYRAPEHCYVETRKQWPFPGTDLYREALCDCGYYRAGCLTEAGKAEAQRILSERAGKGRKRKT